MEKTVFNLRFRPSWLTYYLDPEGLLSPAHLKLKWSQSFRIRHDRDHAETLDSASTLFYTSPANKLVTCSPSIHMGSLNPRSALARGCG